MAAQPGLGMLIKIGDGASPTEAFTTLAGMRTTRFALNNQIVDVTTADDTGRWRIGMAGAAVKSASISGDGVFKDETVDGTLRTNFMAGTQHNFQLVVPGLGTFTGNFLITSLEYGASHDGEVTFSVSLESTGAITFA